MLNGAMGVDKFKVVEGKTIELLRFMCIFVTINSYLRKLRGDSNILPCLLQMTLITLEPSEVLFTDSEDMMSCLNLLKMPDCWAGYFTFEKPVSQSAFGGDPNEMSYVCVYIYIYIERERDINIYIYICMCHQLVMTQPRLA